MAHVDFHNYLSVAVPFGTPLLTDRAAIATLISTKPAAKMPADKVFSDHVPCNLSSGSYLSLPAWPLDFCLTDTRRHPLGSQCCTKGSSRSSSPCTSVWPLRNTTNRFAFPWCIGLNFMLRYTFYYPSCCLPAAECARYPSAVWHRGLPGIMFPCLL